MANKIALINPESPFLVEERVFPNLGILQLATSMKSKGMEFDLVDLSGLKSSEEKIASIAINYDLFGFYSTTPQFPRVMELNRLIKKHNRSAYTVLGGPHSSAVHSLTRDGVFQDVAFNGLDSFDKVVVGEGDEQCEEIFSRDGKRLLETKLVHDIDSIPFPDRSLIDLKSYKYLLHGKETTTLMTQRGCPFGCVFCCGRNIDMYKNVRAKSPKNILAELDHLHDAYGYSSFMWFDDELNVNPLRLKELASLLKTRDYRHRGFVRSDLLVKFPWTLDALADSGFVELCSGTESGSLKILKNINKGTTPEMNATAARMVLDKGLSYKCFMIIGNPGETHDDVEMTHNWLKQVKPTGFDLSILTPYPGSGLYNRSKHSSKYSGFNHEFNGLYFNKIDFSSQDSFYKGRPGQYSCNIRTDDLSSSDILMLRDKIESELKSNK